MPSHVPKPRHKPPTPGDHYEIHSVAIDLSFGAIATALVMMAGRLVPGMTAFMSQAEMPLWVTLLTALFLATGGVLAIKGFTWEDQDDVAPGLLMEKAGWRFQAIGWSGTALPILLHFPLQSVAAWILFFGLSWTAFHRSRVVARIEKRSRPMQDQLDAARAEGDDLPPAGGPPC